MSVVGGLENWRVVSSTLGIAAEGRDPDLFSISIVSRRNLRHPREGALLSGINMLQQQEALTSLLVR